MDMKQFDKSPVLQIYRKMSLIRAFEEKLYFSFLSADMPGTMHKFIGQEGVAVGVSSALRETDFITSAHRGHGQSLAKGADLKAAMAEMFAKDSGLCRGMGGSMHLADFRVGILGANGILAGGLPIAAGAALMAQIRGTWRITCGSSKFGTFATLRIIRRSTASWHGSRRRPKRG